MSERTTAYENVYQNYTQRTAGAKRTECSLRQQYACLTREAFVESALTQYLVAPSASSNHVAK